MKKLNKRNCCRNKAFILNEIIFVFLLFIFFIVYFTCNHIQSQGTVVKIVNMKRIHAKTENVKMVAHVQEMLHISGKILKILLDLSFYTFVIIIIFMMKLLR